MSIHIPTAWPERIQAIASALLQVVIAILVLALLLKSLWLSAFTGGVILLLTFAPALLARQLSMHLPVELSLITSLFLFASFVLGEISDFYTKFWWWDLMLHSLSALTIGLMGFLSVYVFTLTNKISVAPIYVAITTACLAITTGTLWEIFEFLMDWLFQFNMQKSGLIDTMTDLMVNTLASWVAAVLAYLYVRNGDSLLVDKLVCHFVEKNPTLFSQ